MSLHSPEELARIAEGFDALSCAASTPWPPDCPTCHGEGTLERGTSRDMFGNWDTETVRCSDCDGTGSAVSAQKES